VDTAIDESVAVDRAEPPGERRFKLGLELAGCRLKPLMNSISTALSVRVLRESKVLLRGKTFETDDLSWRERPAVLIDSHREGDPLALMTKTAFIVKCAKSTMISHNGLEGRGHPYLLRHSEFLLFEITITPM
jgi:hypothetical protein